MFKGNVELFPIQNQPIHHPIMALDPGPIGYIKIKILNWIKGFSNDSSGRTISRAAYAKLQNVKFPSIKDRFNNNAEVIDEMSFIAFDLSKEESDPLVCNEIYFQFLAFSR